MLLEKRSQPLHVGYLCLLKPPPDAAADFVQKLAQHLRTYCAPHAPFNQRLEKRLGGMAWIKEPDFDIEQHVIHLALPKPGRIRQLLAMVSRVHATHLDRAYPLWRTYLIEGLEDGRIATYSKIHHAVVDGVAGTRLFMKSLSASPDSALPPAWAIPPRELRRRQHQPDVAEGFGDMLRALGGSVRNLPNAARRVRSAVRDFRAGHPDMVSGFDAPPSILNQKISASRRFVAQSFAQSRVKQVARAASCTSNDVVLAMCGGALRRYLLRLKALPDRPLIAGVPVSLRRDRSEGGNQIAFLLANLGTHLPLAEQRLEQVKRSVEYTKQRFMQMTGPEIMAYTLATLGPALVLSTSGLRGDRQFCNVIISNIPGPKATTYWQGCQVDGLYPVSVIADGLALNISLTSRDNQLDFGLLACRRTLPSVQQLLDDLEESLVELEILAH